MSSLHAARLGSGLLRAAMLPVVLFVPAGTARWWEAWAVSGIYLTFSAVVVGMLARHDPALLTERLRASPVREGQPGWDRALMLAMIPAGVALLVVPGLDVVRLGWSARLPLALELVGMALQVPALAFVVWVMWTNAWLARVVKVDPDQRVVSTGPYALVRHPMYAAVIVAVLALPLALGSRWSFVAAAVLVALLVARTALEDRMLHHELEGYPAYAARTRWRLCPGLW